VDRRIFKIPITFVAIAGVLIPQWAEELPVLVQEQILYFHIGRRGDLLLVGVLSWRKMQSVVFVTE
jgi:hypothetical protein